jgi:hypothetical protein
MRKHFITFLLLQLLWTTGFSQSLSFKFGIPFKRSDLYVNWSAPSNNFPSDVWVYHLLPNRPAPETISNLVTLCSFTDKEKTRSDTNWLVYENAEKSRRLGILFSLGSIEYETRDNYSATNLVQGLPTESQLLTMANTLLPKLGVSLSDVEKKEDGTSPDIHVFASDMTFFENHTSITNTIYRGIRFRRAIDGARFVGNGNGGNGEIRFGDHGKISKISLSWRKLEPQKRYSTADPKNIIEWMQGGKAVQGMISMNAEPINWSTVKSVTVTKIKVCYYAGDPFNPSEWLMPFGALWTTVDTGHGNIDVEIDCPIFDTSRPANERTK